MRKFICISGKARSGKDTSARIFKNELIKRGYSVLIIHQADLLKHICKNFFDWDGEKDERGRTLLQNVGTDIIRNADPDFWVNFILKVTGFFKDRWDYIIIPDTRFSNEIENLKKDNTKVFHVRVIRDNYTSSLTPTQQNHPSETALDDYECDFILINNTMDDLNSGIIKIIDVLETTSTEMR